MKVQYFEFENYWINGSQFFFMKTLIVFRGVPGSGKTTKACEMVSELSNKDSVTYHCRDDFRKEIIERWWEMGEDFNIPEARIKSLECDWEDWLEILYQESFKIEWIDSKIKRMWWREVRDAVLSDYDVVILDSTFINVEDLINLHDLIVISDRISICYETTKEYGSCHGVPKDVINHYKKGLEKTRNFIQKIVNRFEFI